MSRNTHISKKTPCFSCKRSKIYQNQMNLKDAFWSWVVTHAQTIQNNAVHLACLEMWVARMNFNLILLGVCLPTSYVEWDFLAWNWDEDRRALAAWANSSGKYWFAVVFPKSTTFCYTSESRGKRGTVDRASDSEYSEYRNGCPAWVRARLVSQICVSFLCPWARHFTLIVQWFGGYVKPSVPCTCI